MHIKHLIVDGSNVTRELFGFDRQAPGRMKLDDLNSRKLLRFLAALRNRLRIEEVIVFFDGTARPSSVGADRVPLAVRVRFGSGLEADDLIVDEVACLHHADPDVVVVTDDRELRHRLMELGVSALINACELEPIAREAGLNTDLYFFKA